MAKEKKGVAAPINEQDPLSMFDNLSSDQFISSLSDMDQSGSRMISNSNTEVNQAKPEPIVEADEAISESDEREKALVLDEEEEVDGGDIKEKPETEVKKDDKKVEDKVEEIDENAELAFSDEDTVVKSTESESGSWIEAAKELGVELEADDFDEFKKKITEKSEYNLGKYKPEAQVAIKFLEAGGSIDDFIEPFSKIDEVMSLSDADLVERHLIGQGWTDEAKRQAKLEQMVEIGELEVVAGNARKALAEYRGEVKDKIIQDKVKAQELYDRRAAEAHKQEAKLIRESLQKKGDFMETKLSPSNIEKVFKKYESGAYAEDFKDSNKIAEFLLYVEYGKHAQQNLKIKAQRELKEKHKEKFHNLPPKGANGGSIRATPSGHDPEGNWDIFDKERGV